MKPTLILRAQELRKHARKIADAIARAHPRGCCVIKRPAPNPTLVAHGLVRASLWHITTADPPVRAVADLYVGNHAEAARITRLLANMMTIKGEPARLRLLDNKTKTAELKAHPRSAVEAMARNPSRSHAARGRRRAARIIKKGGRTQAQRLYRQDSQIARRAPRIATIRRMRQDVEATSVRDWVRELKINQDDAYRGRITFDQFDARQKSIWSAIKKAGATALVVAKLKTGRNPKSCGKIGKAWHDCLHANPKGRNARPTTIREAVAQVLVEAKFPQLVKDVRSGKASPLAALELARKFMHNEHERAVIDRAIRLVRKAGPAANPSGLIYEGTAAELARVMAELRRVKPRTVAQMFGSRGPTAAQIAAHQAQVKAWNTEYRAASKAQKAAMLAQRNPRGSNIPVGSMWTSISFPRHVAKVTGFDGRSPDRMVIYDVTTSSGRVISSGHRMIDSHFTQKYERFDEPSPRLSQPARGGPRVVYNKLLGGWYVVTGAHQTPLGGRFNSKAEAEAWLSGRRANPKGRNPAPRHRFKTGDRFRLIMDFTTMERQHHQNGELGTVTLPTGSARGGFYGVFDSTPYWHPEFISDSAVERSRGRNPKGLNHAGTRIRRGDAAGRQHHGTQAHVAAGAARGSGGRFVAAHSSQPRVGLNNPPTVYDSSGARHQGLNTEAQAVYAERGLNRIGIQTRGVEKRGRRWHVIIANPSKLTLREWSEKYGIDMRQKGGAHWVPDSFVHGEARSELWNLSDYLVSSVSGGTIWLVKRRVGNPMRRNRTKGVRRGVRGSCTSRPRARATVSAPRRHPNPATRDKAAQLVRMFEDRGPIKVRTKRIKAPKPLAGSVAKIGDVVAIAYRSKKFDGKSKDYEHKFSSPKPVLVADPESGDLNIVRGKSPYDLTPDGIIN